MAFVEFRQGSTKPLRVVLRDRKGPIDLTDAQVTFSMKKVKTTTWKVQDASAVVEQQVIGGKIKDKGVVRFNFAPNHTDTPALYDGLFRARLFDGTVVICPGTETDFRLKITPV